MRAAAARRNRLGPPRAGSELRGFPAVALYRDGIRRGLALVSSRLGHRAEGQRELRASWDHDCRAVDLHPEPLRGTAGRSLVSRSRAFRSRTLDTRGPRIAAE